MFVNYSKLICKLNFLCPFDSFIHYLHFVIINACSRKLEINMHVSLSQEKENKVFYEMRCLLIGSPHTEIKTEAKIQVASPISDS